MLFTFLSHLHLPPDNIVPTHPPRPRCEPYLSLVMKHFSAHATVPPPNFHFASDYVEEFPYWKKPFYFKSQTSLFNFIYLFIFASVFYKPWDLAQKSCRTIYKCMRCKKVGVWVVGGEWEVGEVSLGKLVYKCLSILSFIVPQRDWVPVVHISN